MPAVKDEEDALSNRKTFRLPPIVLYNGKQKWSADFRSKPLKIGVSKLTNFRSSGAVFFFS
ncbi:hypothetical protein ACFP56_04870 [Paenibacillus septentrionalis]|uniref:Transposase (putative) YhgA-like domain-containing protein n=1 Tax=Paenibacillus septentrionalis TaxID=429342 RepID=A0ABW1UZQ0_9BACL